MPASDALLFERDPKVNQAFKRLFNLAPWSAKRYVAALISRHAPDELAEMREPYRFVLMDYLASLGPRELQVYLRNSMLHLRRRSSDPE